MKTARILTGILAIVLCAGLCTGCSFLAGDYSTENDNEHFDLDPDGDAGPSDGGDGGSDAGPCNPASASSLFSHLRGPLAPCPFLPCKGWEPVCFGANRQYLVSRVKDDTTTWYDTCYVINPGRTDGKLLCQYGPIHSIEIPAEGNWRSDDDPKETAEWNLFHREVDEFEWLPRTTGCGSSHCEMFDGFALRADRHYFVVRSEPRVVNWYTRCKAGKAGSGQDVLRCTDGHHRRCRSCNRPGWSPRHNTQNPDAGKGLDR